MIPLLLIVVPLLPLERNPLWRIKRIRLLQISRSDIDDRRSYDSRLERSSRAQTATRKRVEARKQWRRATRRSIAESMNQDGASRTRYPRADSVNDNVRSGQPFVLIVAWLASSAEGERTLTRDGEGACEWREQTEADNLFGKRGAPAG